MKNRTSLLIPSTAVLASAVSLMLLAFSACIGRYGLPIPEKEASVYRLESRIRLLERYDRENNTDLNKAEIEQMQKQVAALLKSIADDKKKAAEGKHR